VTGASRGLGRAIAFKLAGEGVKTAIVARRGEVLRDFAAREIPMERFGKAEELAVLAVFLCSPLAGYITGTVIPVDGGMSRFAF